MINSEAQAIMLRNRMSQISWLHMVFLAQKQKQKQQINISPLYFIGIISEKETNCPSFVKALLAHRPH